VGEGGEADTGDDLGGVEGEGGLIEPTDAVIVDAGEVGMGESAEGEKLALEGGAEGSLMGVKRLECDVPITEQVVSEEGVGGGALAERTFENVPVLQGDAWHQLGHRQCVPAGTLWNNQAHHSSGQAREFTFFFSVLIQ